jgi:regulatory protein YycI of two-component signal transduction system YycFG
MKDKRKIIFIVLLFIVVVLIIVLLTTKKGTTVSNNGETKIVDNQAANDVVVESIQFKNITKTYDSGITTIRANIYNNTNESKTFTVKVVLKDASGNELTNATQIIENLGAGKTKVFTTGIAGDYSSVQDIKFEAI